MKAKLIAAVLSVLAVAACADNIAPTAPTDAAERTTAATASSTPMVPSIIFIQYLNQQAPTLFCEQDPGIACLNMPSELCAASAVASQERCGPKLLEQWPASFEENQENAIRYAQEYRNCMLNDWVNEFGLQPERLAACGIELE
jgi:hypothetical protein